MLILRLLVLLLVLVPASAYATVDWDDSFEYSSNLTMVIPTGPYDSSCANTHVGISDPVTTNPHTGSRALRQTYPPPDSEGGCSKVRNHTATEVLYERWWMYVSPTWLGIANIPTKLMFNGPDGVYPSMWWLMTTFDSGSNALSFGVTPQGTAQTPSTFNVYGGTIPRGVYTCVETEVRFGSAGVADGVLRAWINNTQVINRTNIKWRGTVATPVCSGCANNSPTAKMTRTSFYRQHGNGYIDFDEYAVSRDARIGCGSTPIPGDTTPPTQPTITSATASGTQASLVWSASTDGGSGLANYTVLYSTGAASTPSLVAGTAGASTTSFSHTGLTASTIYRYQVRATDIAGNSTISPVAEVTTPAAAVSYYTLVFSDTFTRVDAVTLGASWQSGYGTDTAEAIVSNQLRPVALNQDATQTYGTAIANDIAVSMVLSQGNGSGTRAPGLLTRFSDPSDKDGYECRILLPATARTGEWNTNSFTQKTSVTVSPAWAAGDKVWCETIGTTTSMYREIAGVKTLLTSFVDATHATGKVGIIHYQQTGTLGDVQIDDFAVYSVSSTPSVPPSITNLSINASNTAITHTYGATTPTQIRVHYGSNSRGTYLNEVKPISDFASGVLTVTLPNGTNFYGAFPFDAAGVENSSGGFYINTTTIVPGVDTDPAVMSNPFPSTNRPAGTTEVDYGVELDKPALCRSHTENVSYAEMAPPTGTDLTTTSLVCSGTKTGLTNGSTTTLYISNNFTNEFDEEYPSVTNQVVTIVVDSSTVDTTPPGAPTNPVASPILNSSDITVVWGAASGGDVALYRIYKAPYSSGACGTYVPAGNPVTITSTQVQNAPFTSYCFKVRAEDTSGNLGAFSVETAPITTGDAPDLEPPSDAGNITVTTYTHSAVFTWPIPTDNRGKPTTTVELCTGAACSDFLAVPTVTLDDRLELGLQPSTAYRARIIHCDAAGLCGAYSPIIGFTTTSTGLSSPRIPIRFGVQRQSLSLPRLPNAIQRIPRQ